MAIKLSPYKIIESIILEQGLKFEKEFRFSHPRRFRFDYRVIDPNNPALMLAIEYEGGTFTNGAHGRGAHYSSDCTKYNIATCLGWKVLRYTVDIVQQSPRQISKDLRFIKERGRI